MPEAENSGHNRRHRRYFAIFESVPPKNCLRFLQNMGSAGDSPAPLKDSRP
jgi:hypothetical protein